MGTKINKTRLVFSDFFNNEISNNPLTLIDAGARGGIESPWKNMGDKNLRVIGFEPDKEACDKLNEKSKNITYLPYALWSEKTALNLNVTEDASCSSVYPPNMDLIRRYEEKHWKPRIINKKIQCPATTVDDEVFGRRLDPDFLKVDTHGAEYNILEGAKKTLGKNLFGVLVETWTVEVHKGQATSEKIMEIMKNSGFELFGLGTAAAWKREAGKNLASGKRQIVGLDFLFFKNSDDRKFYKNSAKVLKCAAIAELYGYPDYALELLEKSIAESGQKQNQILKKATEIIKQNSNAKDSFFKKLLRKFKSKIGIKILEYPSLHP